MQCLASLSHVLALILASQLAHTAAAASANDSLPHVSSTVTSLCSVTSRSTSRPSVPSPAPAMFNFSRVSLPLGARLIVKDPVTERSLAAVEPSANCTWLLVKPGAELMFDYVPPPTCADNVYAVYSFDYFNVSDFCATSSGAKMNPGGVCDNADDSSTLRVIAAGTTCPPGKPGWRESPMDKASSGCAPTVRAPAD
ncbi:hypothetical protein ATCC90586_011627 [Pythium insidiosum]|nr:hypothetical protein ATCC90586_011627 [Pythium insidiosum]